MLYRTYEYLNPLSRGAHACAWTFFECFWRVFTFADPSDTPDTPDTPENLTPLKSYDTASVNGYFFIEYSLAIEFIIKLDLTLGEITRVVFHIECVTWCFIYGQCKLYYFDSQFQIRFPNCFEYFFFQFMSNHYERRGVIPCLWWNAPHVSPM